MANQETKTLLIIYPGRDVNYDFVFDLFVAETGEHLASHLCSHYGYAIGDLYSDRPEKIREFEKRFGNVEVKYIDETDVSPDDLFARNKKWFKSINNPK